MTFVISVISSSSYLFSRLRRPSPHCDATCRSHPRTFSSSGASPSQTGHSAPEMRPSHAEGHSDTLLCCLFFLNKSSYFTCFFDCCWALCECFLSAPQDLNPATIVQHKASGLFSLCSVAPSFHTVFNLPFYHSVTHFCFALLMLISTTTVVKKLHLLTNQSLFQYISEYVGRLVTSLHCDNLSVMPNFSLFVLTFCLSICPWKGFPSYPRFPRDFAESPH